MNPNPITQWLKAHKINSHALALLLISAATAYTTSDTVKSLVNPLLVAHPKIAALLGATAGLILRYSNSLKAL